MWTGSWPTFELQQQRRSLENLRDLAQNQAPETSDELNSVLARFLVVRACGYLEQVVEQTCLQYLNSKSSHPWCQSFNGSWFGRGRNPSPNALVAFVKKIDLSLSEDLESLFQENDDLLLREISFLVDRRNKISHGLSEGVGTRKALDLVPPTVLVADWFLDNFNPNN